MLSCRLYSYRNVPAGGVGSEGAHHRCDRSVTRLNAPVLRPFRRQLTEIVLTLSTLIEE